MVDPDVVFNKISVKGEISPPFGDLNRTNDCGLNPSGEL